MDGNVEVRDRLMNIQKTHKIQVIGICPTFGMHNFNPQLSLMRLDLIDLDLNKAKKHFSSVIDPANIERSLNDIL